MEKYEEAKVAIDKALSIEPQNANYLNTKKDIMEKINKTEEKEEKKEEKEEPKQQEQQSNGGGFSNLLNSLMSNPAIQQMAQNIASNPEMMSNLANMFSSLMGGANPPPPPQ